MNRVLNVLGIIVIALAQLSGIAVAVLSQTVVNSSPSKLKEFATNHLVRLIGGNLVLALVVSTVLSIGMFLVYFLFRRTLPPSLQITNKRLVKIQFLIFFLTSLIALGVFIINARDYEPIYK